MANPDSIMGKIRAMEVGDQLDFPIEKLQYIAVTCSVFSRTIGKKYKTSYKGGTTTVRRIA